MKTILVTGASSGIGRALAVRAARAGYAVYAVARNRESLAALEAKIEGESGFVAIDATDIAVAADARALVGRVLARFGSIDVLVNNAGFVSAGPLVAQSDAELQRQFGTHVIGPVALIRESLEALRRARGHVFMLGSGVARVPVGGLGAYPPAKAALRSATAILRRELHPLGIAVTYVDPGAVDTPFMKRAGMPGAPANVLVSPEQVARKILIAAAKRPRVLNVVAWQTAAVALAERFPRITDFLLDRAPSLVGGNPGTELPAPSVATHAETIASPMEHNAAPGRPEQIAAGTPEPKPSANPQPHAPPASTDIAVKLDQPPEANEPQVETEPRTQAEDEPASAFELALEPHRRRMKKLNFQVDFVRSLLVPEATIDLGEVALRWAGMPNKNERAVTEEVLEALTEAGFLEHAADHAYRVVRAP